MKIFEVYQNLLTETNIQACVKRFGYELFGHELGGTEKNTKLEKDYVEDIRDFTDKGHGPNTTNNFLGAMETLKGCVKQYPEVLIPEKTAVYRGLTIPIDYFIQKKETINLLQPFEYIYRASNKVQSWSTNPDAASIFGNHDQLNEMAKNLNLAEYQTPEARAELLKLVQAEKLRAAFILQYKTNPSEFIFKSEYFRLISQVYHEDELIRIDNKPIKVMAKFNDHIDVFMTYKGTQLVRLISRAISEI